ncbi:Tim44 domain-containing protein [Ramlibacter sp.]|uniref:Tim44 domain-containing protein n=1 Tax=Ramlibacter sp. TaxID=1917967 RepID=UPI003D11F164
MKIATAFLAAVMAVGMATSFDAEAAKRLGGGKSSGMQRQQTTQPAGSPGSPASPSQAAPATAGAAAAAAPAAAAAKRSWMGPLAGLAAGLGLAALASHFGFGEALANFMLFALLGVVILAAVAFFMRRRAANAQSGGPAYAGAGAGGMGNNTLRSGLGSQGGNEGAASGGAGSGLRIGSGLAPVTAASVGTAGTIPADFDVPAFVRNAKSQFMALQAANDAGDLDRLRDYLTPEMFDAIAADVRERNGATQHTEVFGLEASVVEVVEEADRYIVSVRFTGSTRGEHGAVPDDLDEIWHLVKPRAGFGGWAIAGIQQVTAQ